MPSSSMLFSIQRTRTDSTFSFEVESSYILDNIDEVTGAYKDMMMYCSKIYEVRSRKLGTI